MNFIKQQKQEILNFFNDKNIAVLHGGMSEEREVSLRSGANVYKALQSFDSLKDRVHLIDVTDGYSLVEQLKKHKIDYCYNILHGTYGEDGKVQGLLDMLGIFYTGEGTTTSALCMDKVRTKIIWHDRNLISAKFDILEHYRSADEKALHFSDSDSDSIAYPLIIKPIENGSSVGVNLIHNKSEFDSFIAGIEDKNKDQYFVEQYIKGKEYTAGIVKMADGGHYIFPILAIFPKKEMYDYEAKYTKGMTSFEIPAKIEKDIETKALEIVAKAYDTLDARGVCRIDFIIDEHDDIYLLECNTQCGMTETSDIPEMARAASINFGDLVLYILSLAIK